MFTLVSENMLISFFDKFNIDFTLFSNYEQGTLILLANIFFCLFWFFILYIFYRIVYKLI